jgi:hypothetical protein
MVLATEATSTQLVPVPEPDAELFTQRTPDGSTSTNCALLRPATCAPYNILGPNQF